MPFRNPDEKTFRTYVTLGDGRRAIRSCGTTDRTTAKLIEGVVRQLTQARDWEMLTAVFDGRVSLGQVYDASRFGTLDTLRAQADDIDLAPLVNEWEKYTEGRGVKVAHEYVRHVRALVGRQYHRSAFTKPRLSDYLAALECSGATRNRHRGSLTQFGEWLVERGVLETNPVRGIRGARESKGRLIYYTKAEAQAVLGALPSPFRALEALMCGSGMEWAAASTVAIRDVNFDARTVHAHGTKNEWRDREVVVVEDWCWDLFAPYARGFIGGGFLFATVPHQTALNTHKRAVKAANLHHSTLHDWRHTFAVMQRRKGVLDSVIAHQLGHHDTRLVAQRYGRFRVEAQDYQQRLAVNA